LAAWYRLSQSPIRRVLSSMRTHRAEALLMGGQACVHLTRRGGVRATDLAMRQRRADGARVIA
jgi:hypothetical protein